MFKETHSRANSERAKYRTPAVPWDLVIVMRREIERPVIGSTPPVTESSATNVLLHRFGRALGCGVVRKVKREPLFKKPVRIRPFRIKPRAETTREPGAVNNSAREAFQKMR